MRITWSLIITVISFISNNSILLAQTDCNNLKVVSAIDVVVNCIGTANLEVKGSEAQNTGVLWYTSPTDSIWFHEGVKLETPVLTENTSYWVTDALLKRTNVSHQGIVNREIGTSKFVSQNKYGLLFEAFDNFKLKSIDVHPDRDGVLEITLFDSSGKMIGLRRFDVTSSMTPITLPLDFQIKKGEAYQLFHTSNPIMGLSRNISNLNFPYKLGVDGELGAITAGAYYNENNPIKTAFYYFFYNWDIEHTEVICESPRKEVFVKLSQDADELITELPFSHSENTATYGNNLSGQPGEGCGVKENYLNGEEVIYKYQAINDDLITVELTDLNKFYTGIFIYESCGDIGSSCIASYTAGPTMDNVIIKDMEIEKGKVYYIVVSSWFTRAIDYTINITGFLCSDLEMPLGDPIQYFVIGDTLDKLEVEATRPNATITWYSNPELTNKISDPSLTNLEDGNKYYVTQTINNCESQVLVITSKQLSCNNLAVINVMNAEADCAGLMLLDATASGIGNQLYWYESDTDQVVIARGNSFKTPHLTHTKSYWVSEGYTSEMVPIKGQAKKISNNAQFTNQADVGLYFEAFNPFMIFDVEIYSTGTSASITIELIDEADNVINQRIVTIPAGNQSSPTPYTIPLNFFVPKQGVYRLMILNNGASFTMLREGADHVNYPYPLATFGKIINGAYGKSTTKWYPYFYNWTVGEENIVCESTRQEVIAKVKQSGDITINNSDLPYLDRANTSFFNNNYSGSPGSNCLSGNYLDGYEAIYHYVSDSTKDNVLKIQLSDVDNLDASIFVYNSCGKIGLDCIDGAIIQDGKAVINDLYIEAGEDIQIVVTSASGNTSYTLNIEDVACGSLDPPSGDTSPSFIQGETVSDLTIDNSEFIQEVTWYRNADLTDKITSLNTEFLVDGASYYVTQTILGCESNPLKITPIELNDELTGVHVESKNNYLCMPGGMITLQVEPNGIGNDVYWYDSETDGNVIGTGESIEVFIEEDTSYWVAEVQKRSQGTPGNSLLESYCKPYFYSRRMCIYGDNINDFTLQDDSENIFISHLNTGCSTNGYGDFTKAKYLHANLNAGETYNFKATHKNISENQYVNIWIDFNGNGSFEDSGELVYQATDAGSFYKPSIGSFQIPENIMSINTVMRVKNVQSNQQNNNSCSQLTDFGEVHDYRISIIGKDIIYESPREKISVITNNNYTREPNLNTHQFLCSSSLLSDIKVLGPNIKWYDERGKKISASTSITKDAFYYVTQTIRGCESAMKEIYIEIMEESNPPKASINQAFSTGDSLKNIKVEGEQLTWYKDKWKSEMLTLSTLLEDQQTYYVTQVEEDKCESKPIGITVHELLSVKSNLFNKFTFSPNPINNVLYISNSHNIEKIEIYDLTGRKVYKQNHNSRTLEVDVSDLASGTYLLKVKVEQESKSFRAVKKIGCINKLPQLISLGREVS